MNKTEKTRVKRRFGDRRDGTLVRDADSMHVMLPYIYPNRCDNEAFISEQIDITALEEFIADKNSSNPEYKYKIFQAILAAFVVVAVKRPRLNRFIQGKRMYQRNDLSAAFVIKKEFSDNGGEALAYMVFPDDSTIDSVHDAVEAEVKKYRGETKDNATQSLDTFSKIPHPIRSILMSIVQRLDYHGWSPEFITKGDPDYASVFISNLGSIKLNAAYHHLTARGTNSLFVVIGEIHKAPFYREDGSFELRRVVDLGITLDERIADGYYYAKSVHLLKTLLQNPSLLNIPANSIDEKNL